MKKYDRTNCIHLENDVLIYDNLCIPDTSKVWITMDCIERCIPGIMFIPSFNTIQKLIEYYMFDKNDMENLAYFYHHNKNICDTFPIININSKYNNQTILNQNFNKFNKIFDGAAIGQYLGGVDPRNINGDTRGFINETCSINYANFSFSWIYNTELKLYQPNIIIDNKNIIISNLHIHSKALANFMANNPVETKLIKKDDSFLFKLSSIEDFVTGEKLQELTNCYIGLPEDFSFNPRISVQQEKQLNIQEINNVFDNSNIIFCYAHRLSYLQEKLQYFKNPFILITHNSDENIDSRYESLLYSNKIIKWYAQNVLLDHPKLHILPIGIANSMWSHGNLSILQEVLNNPLPKINDIYFYFTVSTNQVERERCKIELENKGLVFSQFEEYHTYLKNLTSYKFAICPPGNGIDSHRIWECYYCGVIPIVLKNHFTEKLNKLLPCILLDTWNDFNYSDILSQYGTVLHNLCENKKYLNLTYYREQFQWKQPKKVWFYLSGRTGNNIFQYLAAEVIKYIYNFDIVEKIDHIPDHLLQITDESYTNIINNFIKNPNESLTSNCDIILNGYFQKSSILLYLRDYVLKYYNSINYTKVNDTYTISDFVQYQTQHNLNITINDIVLHLRLDDYIHHNNPPNIFNKEQLANLLDTFTFDKLYIVCDKINKSWEEKYIKYFTDKYNTVFVSGSLLDDFTLLKNTKRLIISQSTYSWLAAYFGNADEVIIPYSDFYKEHSILKECHNNCKIYYGLQFATDLLD